MTIGFLTPVTLEAGLLAAFDQGASDLDSRKSAYSKFAKTGLPHRKLEAWKWSDFRTALSDLPVEQGSGEIQVQAPSIFSQAGAFTITLDSDGAHWGDNCPAGVSLRLTDNVADRLDLIDDHPMASLAAAMSTETLIITVAAGQSVTAPIHIRRSGAASDGAQRHHRVLVSIDEDASVGIIESIDEPTGALFDNLLTEVRLGARAHLSRTVYSNVGDNGVEISTCAIVIDGGAVFDQFALLAGGKRSRLETISRFDGPDAHARSFSASILGSARHADFTSEFIHDAEGCIVEQMHKSVIRERGHGIFQGKFLVERTGQKTDANMQANAMLLSEGATINHKPELEIYADDVACAHGSTSGALDDDAIFYMRQRGLSDEAARSLLIDAFLAEVFDEMEEAPLVGARQADILRNVAASWKAGGA